MARMAQLATDVQELIARHGIEAVRLAVSQLTGCRCVKCGNEWQPRVTDRLPVQCPRCKSKYWRGPAATTEE